MAEYKLNYTGEKVQSILELAEGQIPDIKNKAYSKVEKTTRENGRVILSFSNINDVRKADIELPLDAIVLGETITTKVDVGKIPGGTTINSGESLQSILKRIFCGDGTDIPVTGVTLNKSTTSIIINKTETLIATVLPENATNKNVTWTSSDNEIATVSSAGVVTAKSLGNATITVTTEDGGFTATCAIAVEPVRVKSVSLDKTSLPINIGSTAKLNATIVPSNAANKNVTWTSSDTSVATVVEDSKITNADSTATITAIKEGNTMITVTTEDGSKTATCNVNVITSTSKVGYYAGPSIATTIGGDNWTFKDEQISATSLIYEYYTTVKSYYAVAYPKTRGELKHIYQNDFTEVDLISDFVKESATYNDVEYWLYKWETRQSATAPEKDKFEYIF